MLYYQIKCGCYKENTVDISDSVCGICGNPISGFINTRRASIEVEKSALEERYLKALEYLKRSGLQAIGEKLEQHIKTEGKAVINVNFEFLWSWLVRGGISYESYRRQLISGSRQKAKFGNDLKRSVVDSMLFGSEVDILYAALSLDERGLESYGGITVIIKTSAILNRTSALETNSFHFVEEAISKKGWSLDEPLPSGYMSIWPDIHKLAIAKLHPLLEKTMNFSKLAKLVLSSTGDRSTDEFIELYIWGNLNPLSIEKILIPTRLSTALDSLNKIRLEELKAKYDVREY